MKNTIKYTKRAILSLALVSSISGFANNSYHPNTEDDDKTAIVLENVKEGHLLSILDNQGATLYQEVITTNGHYEKGFDLKSLPDGNYIFELQRDLEVSTIPFHVASNNVNFDKKDEASYFKPYIKLDNNLVIISKLALNLEKTLIEIYAVNKSDIELLYAVKVEDVQVIEKAFKIEKGNFKIVVSSNNKKHTTLINN